MDRRGGAFLQFSYSSTHRQFWSERSRVRGGRIGGGEGKERRKSSGSGKREMGRESRSARRLGTVARELNDPEGGSIDDRAFR